MRGVVQRWKCDCNGENCSPGDNQHGHILRRGSEDRANEPDNAADKDGLLPAEHVSNGTRDERTEERSTRHRSRDASLERRGDFAGSPLANVAEILVEDRQSENDGEGGNVEAEEEAADAG